MARARNDAFGVAQELRRQFRRRGEFTQGEYREALHEALEEFQSDAYEGFVDHIAERVDRASAKEEVSRQPTLPGITWDLEGELHLDCGRRIAKRLARIEHAQKALQLDDENLITVQKANVRKRKELLDLQPYWNRPGVTKEQAVAAYEADHTEKAS